MHVIHSHVQGWCLGRIRSLNTWQFQSFLLLVDLIFTRNWCLHFPLLLVCLCLALKQILEWIWETLIHKVYLLWGSGGIQEGIKGRMQEKVMDDQRGNKYWCLISTSHLSVSILKCYLSILRDWWHNSLKLVPWRSCFCCELKNKYYVRTIKWASVCLGKYDPEITKDWSIKSKWDPKIHTRVDLKTWLASKQGLSNNYQQNASSTYFINKITTLDQIDLLSWVSTH